MGPSEFFGIYFQKRKSPMLSQRMLRQTSMIMMSVTLNPGRSLKPTSRSRAKTPMRLMSNVLSPWA